jgi:hypothetical protein
MDVSVSVASLRHEPKSFPEGDTLDGGIEGHHPNASGALALDTGPTESPADVEAPHPQRVGDDWIDGNAADGSQHAFRVHREQRLTGSVKTHRTRRPIVRESIEKPVTFGTGLCSYSVEISG